MGGCMPLLEVEWRALNTAANVLYLHGLHEAAAAVNAAMGRLVSESGRVEPWRTVDEIEAHRDACRVQGVPLP